MDVTREKSIKLQYPYYGWLIEIIPSSKGYIFQCWIEDEQIAISDNHVYHSKSQAVRAAKKRAKLESTTFAIIQLLHEFNENYHINAQEYTSLLNSIVRFSNFASQVKDA
ncbi:hypothetical protein PN480_12065 [Dolichospermum circinale CS-1225]|uniref:hypothetical protein n=1 Tax=Dolichospermum circinale TaxID=109265 RepID=UPI0003F62D48|nr:hypothetical protein [Dolichospermum circinale]MDB9459170.1 hypothetical protein [Dolichospermum circinale CS-545/17]MDB9468249.1 hypothetical protein [Dolichospermum circinale CS-539/09]MDB9470114.1 hypothetical protein [Dolichospermum circinale CS-539]MDB9522679.1 hypothetical protein [Dolichospermum circinale CS-1225]